MPIFDTKAKPQKKPNNKERGKKKGVEEVKVKQIDQGNPMSQCGKNGNQQAHRFIKR